MLNQFIEASIDINTLPVRTIIKRNLLTVSQQLRMDRAVLSLQLLLNSSQSTE